MLEVSWTLRWHHHVRNIDKLAFQEVQRDTPTWINCYDWFLSYMGCLLGRPLEFVDFRGGATAISEWQKLDKLGHTVIPTTSTNKTRACNARGNTSIFTNYDRASATKVSKSQNSPFPARFCVPRRSRNAPKRGPSKLSDFDFDFEALQAAS